jgi:2-polyprenyl-6-methoxyphenol hydroxylase-like FAD-dependent oxidoreductase
MSGGDSIPEADVLVVGAGPVGLWLAAELRLAGATVTVLEKRTSRTIHSRALTLHARTLEIFASRGVAGPWLDEGMRIPTTHYAMLASRLDLTGLASDYPFVLFIPQVRTEELLEQHAIATGVRVLRGLEVSAIAMTGEGVSVTAAGPDSAAGAGPGRREFSGRFLVGCDGRRSIVRTASGIGYTGTGDTITAVIGDVLLTDEDVPPAVTTHSEAGSFYGVRIDGARYRLIGIDHASMSIPRSVALGFDEFRATIRRLTGRDFGMHDPTWLSRAGSATFQADRYRRDRTLLAGDAAHVHFPMGGQGLNLGLHDAMNLGWKLAAVCRAAAPPALLDTYELERVPVGRAVGDDTLAQTALVAAPGREGQALRAMMTAALTENRALNSRLAVFASGIGVTYPPADGAHPLAGRRVPNLRIEDGSEVFQLLRRGTFCVIGIPPSAIADILGPHALTDLAITPSRFAAGFPPWDQIGAALIRPDGHLAWAADGETAPGLAGEAVAALLRWLPDIATAARRQPAAG